MAKAWFGPIGVVAVEMCETIWDYRNPPPDYATIEDVQSYVQGAFQQMQGWVERYVDSELQKFRVEIMNEIMPKVRTLVTTAIDANSLQEVQVEARALSKEFRILQSSQAMEPDAQLAYLLSLNGKMRHLADLLFMPCLRKGWGSTDCGARVAAGATLSFATLVPMHLATLRKTVQLLQVKLRGVREHVFGTNSMANHELTAALLTSNFNRFGCPSSALSAETLGLLKSTSSPQEMLSVMPLVASQNDCHGVFL